MSKVIIPLLAFIFLLVFLLLVWIIFLSLALLLLNHASPESKGRRGGVIWGLIRVAADSSGSSRRGLDFWKEIEYSKKKQE